MVSGDFVRSLIWLVAYLAPIHSYSIMELVMPPAGFPRWTFVALFKCLVTSRQSGSDVAMAWCAVVRHPAANKTFVCSLSWLVGIVCYHMWSRVSNFFTHF